MEVLTRGVPLTRPLHGGGVALRHALNGLGATASQWGEVSEFRGQALAGSQLG